MRTRRGIGLSLLLLLAAAVVWLVHRPVVSNPVVPPPARTVKFPAAYTLGTLYARNWGATGERWEKLGQARGRVAVRAGRELMLDFWPGSASRKSPLRSLLRKVGVDVSDSTVIRGKVEDLRALRPTDLQALSFGRTRVYDKDLNYIKRWITLHSLDLYGKNITNKGLARLRTLTSLRRLNLRSTWITDEGLARLAKLSTLEALDLGANAIHGPGLAYLKSLKSLRELDLTGAEVTDEGLKFVAELDSLERLDLGGTKITTPTVTLVEKALPECRVTTSVAVYYRPPWRPLPW